MIWIYNCVSSFICKKTEHTHIKECENEVPATEINARLCLHVIYYVVFYKLQKYRFKNFLLLDYDWEIKSNMSFETNTMYFDGIYCIRVCLLNSVSFIFINKKWHVIYGK